MPRLRSRHLGPVTGRLVRGALFRRCVRLTSGRRRLRPLHPRARYRLPPSPCLPSGLRQRRRPPCRSASPGSWAQRPAGSQEPCRALGDSTPAPTAAPSSVGGRSLVPFREPDRSCEPGRRCLRRPLRLHLRVCRRQPSPSRLLCLVQARPVRPIKVVFSRRPSRSRRLPAFGSKR